MYILSTINCSWMTWGDEGLYCTVSTVHNAEVKRIKWHFKAIFVSVAVLILVRCWVWFNYFLPNKHRFPETDAFSALQLRHCCWVMVFLENFPILTLHSWLTVNSPLQETWRKQKWNVPWCSWHTGESKGVHLTPPECKKNTNPNKHTYIIGD